MLEQKAEVQRAALSFCRERLFSDAGRRALSYLTEERAVSVTALNEFNVGLYEADSLYRHLLQAGFDTDLVVRTGLIRRSFQHNLVFPWLLPDGVVGGLVFRTLPYAKDVPADRFNRRMRYAFTGDRDALGLYGLEQAIAARHCKLAIVEGTISLLALRSSGLTDVVAANSCQIRVWHARDLKQRGVSEVRLCLDADIPGRRGTLRSIEACMAVGLRVLVAEPPPVGCDPDDVVRREGPSAFRLLVDHSECGLAYMAKRIIDGSSEARPDIAYSPPPSDEVLRRAAAFCSLRPPHLATDDLQSNFWPIVQARVGCTTAEVGAALAFQFKQRIAERGRLQAL